MKLGSYDGPGFQSCALFSQKTTSKIYKDACFCKRSYLKKKKKKKKNTLVGSSNDNQSLKTILPSPSQDLWLQGPSGPITSLSNYGFCGFFCLFTKITHSLSLCPASQHIFRSSRRLNILSLQTLRIKLSFCFKISLIFLWGLFLLRMTLATHDVQTRILSVFNTLIG